MQETILAIAVAIVLGVLYLLWEIRMHKQYDYITNAADDAKVLIGYIREQETEEDALDTYLMSISQMKMYEDKIPADKYLYHLTCLNSAYTAKCREIMKYVFGKPLNNN
jgi:transposase